MGVRNWTVIPGSPVDRLLKLLPKQWSGVHEGGERKHPPVRRARMRLRRHDGQVYLERWGVESKFLGGVFLHRMDAGDPGIDLHDHPWWFVTVPLLGGYIEERTGTRVASQRAANVELYAELKGEDPWDYPRGHPERVRRWVPRVMRLDECHRITALTRAQVWTLVLHGPHRRPWGFYTPEGWVDEHTYDETVRVNRRDLWNEEHP